MKTLEVFKSAYEEDMFLSEVSINYVGEDHTVRATLVWVESDVDKNERKGYLQVKLIRPFKGRRACVIICRK